MTFEDRNPLPTRANASSPHGVPPGVAAGYEGAVDRRHSLTATRSIHRDPVADLSEYSGPISGARYSTWNVNSSSAGIEFWNSVRTSRSLRPSATAQKYHPFVARFRNARAAADGVV